MRSRMVALIVLLSLAGSLAAQDLAPLTLPPPLTSGGKPLLDALRERRSRRVFAPRPISRDTLSNLLWAACGVNRPETGLRTAPTAHNRRDLDVYVVLADGAYRYDPEQHVLLPVAKGDLRAYTGTQPFVKDAPLNLVYVQRPGSGTMAEIEQAIYGGAEAGAVAQNVYLFCASEGLATVVRSGIARSNLAIALKLEPGHQIILAQSVGHPKG